LLTRGPFSYSKAYLRSYKDFVPNHYVLGYFMTTYLKRHHGPEAWGRILTRTYNLPFQPFRFSWAIKKETGMRVETLYQQTVREIDSLWTGQGSGLPEQSAAVVLPATPNKVFTNYQYPQYLPDGRILAQKSGLSHIDQFVALHREGGEQRIFVPGFLGESVTLSAANGRVVWTEQAFHPRWGQRDYSVIKVYDLGTRKRRQLSHQTRLGAPALSPDGRQIVAVQVLPNNTYNLVILDGQTGRVIKVLPNPENDFYITPRFTADGQAVVAVKRNRNGKTIEWIALPTGERRELVPYSGLNLSNPVAYGDYVYFNSPRTGIDNIFAVHVPTGRQYQVTNRKFGAYNATLSPNGREMAYQDFTPNGFRIVTQPVDTTAWTPLESVTDRTVAYYQPLIEQEGGHSILGDVPQQSLPVRRYRQWKQLFNPYSWGPLVSSSGQALEVSLSSQDLLSTTLVDVGYGYDANQNTGSFFANLSYQGWYPVLDATFSTGMRQTSLSIDRQAPIDSVPSDTWRENRFSAGVRLPFTFTRSKYSENLTLGAAANVTAVSGYDLPVRFFSETGNGTLYDTRYSLSYNRLLKTAPRDVLPRRGQTLSLQFRHTPFRGDFSGQIFTAQAGLLLPGLGRHHGLWLRGGYQREDLQRNRQSYRFPTTLLFPRGFAYQSFERFVKGSLDYRLPILYPDLALWRLVYLQRIKGNLFYDAGRGVTEGSARYFYSIGLDLTADFNVLRLLP
ncbi:MAG: hypothetical protein ICV83_31505, partial [Cytophagales bacterium]|nr:hypothetical protein [Cytophagales bacterium]